MATLADLNGKTIRLSVPIKGVVTTFCGVAHYVRETESGPILRVTVSDEAEKFDFIIQESLWDGEIQDGDLEYDYLIRLKENERNET
jgi:hypothetical protein